MPNVTGHKDANGETVVNVFDRVATEGDAIRFLSAENGHRELISVRDTTVSSAGIPKVSKDGLSYTFQLDFDYIVGSNQLDVHVPSGSAYSASPGYIEWVRVSSIDERNLTAQPGWLGPSASNFSVYFEETSSNSVKVYGITDPPGIVLFSVPHTSTPAALRGKVIILDQGDQVALELRGEGDGVLLKAPNGSKYLLRVDNSGTLTVEPR